MDKYMEHEILKLANQLCFPMYVCSKEIVNLYKPYLDEIDLTYTQYITLMVLWEHKKTTVSELGEFLYLDSGTLTPLLKRLESKGFIRRERSAEDERQVNVTITESGESLKEKAAQIPGKIGQCVPLSKEEAGQLYGLLYKIINSIKANEKTSEDKYAK